MERLRLLKEAIKYAEDFTIQHSGITKDGNIVMTLECVEHQKKNHNLFLHINGNWQIKGTLATGKGWVQTNPTTVTICK